MNIESKEKITATITELYKDSRNDKLKMMKGMAKSMFRPMQPSDFAEAYLSISQEQGDKLINLITKHGLKNIVEFGTSFGISTLFLAKGALETGGNIITTELLESKANQANKNFETAGVKELIEIRVGNAIETLKNHNQPIDLLLLDGWKDLYLPLFRMLEPNFHNGTFIYVDNANMSDSIIFLKTIAASGKYHLESLFDGTVVMITCK